MCTQQQLNISLFGWLEHVSYMLHGALGFTSNSERSCFCFFLFLDFSLSLFLCLDFAFGFFSATASCALLAPPYERSTSFKPYLMEGAAQEDQQQEHPGQVGEGGVRGNDRG